MSASLVTIGELAIRLNIYEPILVGLFRRLGYQIYGEGKLFPRDCQVSTDAVKNLENKLSQKIIRINESDTRLAAIAQSMVNSAIKNGELKRSDTCELCGVDPKVLLDPSRKARHTIAHHWNGYDNPLEVWFICYGCNYHLRGKHDGSFTKEEAAAFVNSKGSTQRRQKQCGLI